jgi:hypothetical protein
VEEAGVLGARPRGEHAWVGPAPGHPLVVGAQLVPVTGEGVEVCEVGQRLAGGQVLEGVFRRVRERAR